MPQTTTTACAHSTIYTSPSPRTPFQRPSPHQRRQAAATTNTAHDTTNDNPSNHGTSGVHFERHDAEDDVRAHVFPGPLALPDAALSIDPDEEPQDFASWLDTATREVRNRVTKRRNKLYLVPPPDAASEHGLQGWDEPSIPDEALLPSSTSTSTSTSTSKDKDGSAPYLQQQPSVHHLADQLAAFYHLMPVQPLEGFHWAEWSQSRRTKVPRVGLATPSGQVFGIRHRPGPDGVAVRQLNLTDITDAMMACVPADAHAVAMVVPWDLYEDDDDDFCCGRAYGGSRVCIVSSFRYRPDLDAVEGVDRSHMWPASHCGAYVDRLSRLTARQSRREPVDEQSAMGRAVRAASPVLVPKTDSDYDGLWFSRVARTLCHEVGHCFTLGHCVFYACVMQGTAGMAEDVRQPPYLCPVCLEKVAYNMTPLAAAAAAAAAKGAHARDDWVQGHYRALRDVARKWSHVGMYAGWEAWLDTVLDEVSASAAVQGEDGTKEKKNKSSRTFAKYLEDDDDDNNDDDDDETT